jgi:hypothetical protein
MNRMSVAEAARALGVSVQAVHGRVNRGTIEHEREDGMVYVYLSDEELGNQPVDNPVINEVYNAYIDSLKSEIQNLREETRRKDHLLAAALERIPAIEAPSEPAESPVSPSETQSRGDVSPDPQNSSERLSWWRRLLQ